MRSEASLYNSQGLGEGGLVPGAHQIVNRSLGNYSPQSINYLLQLGNVDGPLLYNCRESREGHRL